MDSAPSGEETSIDPADPDIVSNEDFVGIATAAIHAAKQADAEKVDWSDLCLGPHRAGVEPSVGAQEPAVSRRKRKPQLGLL